MTGARTLHVAFKDEGIHGLMCGALLGHSYPMYPKTTFSCIANVSRVSLSLPLSNIKRVFKKTHSPFCICCLWTVGSQQTSSWTLMGTVKQSASTLSLTCTWASWKRCRVSVGPGHPLWGNGSGCVTTEVSLGSLWGSLVPVGVC